MSINMAPKLSIGWAVPPPAETPLNPPGIRSDQKGFGESSCLHIHNDAISDGRRHCKLSISHSRREPRLHLYGGTAHRRIALQRHNLPNHRPRCSWRWSRRAST